MCQVDFVQYPVCPTCKAAPSTDRRKRFGCRNEHAVLQGVEGNSSMRNFSSTVHAALALAMHVVIVEVVVVVSVPCWY